MLKDHITFAFGPITGGRKFAPVNMYAGAAQRAAVIVRNGYSSALAVQLYLSASEQGDQIRDQFDLGAGVAVAGGQAHLFALDLDTAWLPWVGVRLVEAPSGSGEVLAVGYFQLRPSVDLPEMLVTRGGYG